MIPVPNNSNKIKNLAYGNECENEVNEGAWNFRLLYAYLGDQFLSSDSESPPASNSSPTISFPALMVGFHLAKWLGKLKGNGA